MKHLLSVQLIVIFYKQGKITLFIYMFFSMSPLEWKLDPVWWCSMERIIGIFATNCKVKDVLTMYPLDAGGKLNVHKMFSRSPGRFSEHLMYVQFTSYIQGILKYIFKLIKNQLHAILDVFADDYNGIRTTSVEDFLLSFLLILSTFGTASST